MLQVAVEAFSTFSKPIPVLHSSKHIQFFLSSPGQEEKAARMIRESVDAAHALGAEVVVVHAWDGRFLELDMDMISKTMADCASYAAGCGVTLSVEALPSRAGYPGVLVRQLLDACPLLSFTLDFEYAAIYDMFSYLLDMSDRLSNVHLRDYDGHWIIEGRRAYVRPGLGRLDFPALIGSIKDAGYEGNYSLEAPYDSMDDLEHDISYLGSIIG
jgi:sugar phosphate isomerase/epimerase